MARANLFVLHQIVCTFSTLHQSSRVNFGVCFWYFLQIRLDVIQMPVYGQPDKLIHAHSPAEHRVRSMFMWIFSGPQLVLIFNMALHASPTAFPVFISKFHPTAFPVPLKFPPSLHNHKSDHIPTLYPIYNLPLPEG